MTARNAGIPPALLTTAITVSVISDVRGNSWPLSIPLPRNTCFRSNGGQPGRNKITRPLINPQHGRPQGLRPDDLAVVKTSGVLSCEWVKGRIFLQVVDRTLEVFNEQTSQVTAQAEAGHDPLDDQVAAISGHWISGNLPPSHAQPVCQVIKRKAGMGSFLDLPTAAWHPAAAVINHFEGSEAFHLVAYPRTNIDAAWVTFA